MRFAKAIITREKKSRADMRRKRVNRIIIKDTLLLKILE